MRGNILTNTPGDPSSYTTWSANAGKFEKIGDTQGLTNAGEGNGSLVIVRKVDTTIKEDSFSVGLEECLQAGFGVGAAGNHSIVGFKEQASLSGGGCQQQRFCWYLLSVAG